ncbi:MAG: CpaB family protein [Planctomycetota bacterium]
MMRVQKTAKSLLLMLCIIFCVCLFLTRPVNETQSDGTSALLASAIPPGMQAFTASFSSKDIPDKTLLYPGCVVDVKFSLKLKRSRIREMIPDFIVDALVKCKLIRKNIMPISTTMLRGIKVLAIKRGRYRTHVTLLVDTNQAEALSLAIKNATILLTPRKPSDYKRARPRPDKPIGMINNRKMQLQHDFRIGPCPDEILPRQKSTIVPIPQNPSWEVTLIRGRNIQRIRPGTASSRQQPGFSSLTATDENGDKWFLGLVKGQSLSSLKNSGTKPGQPLLVKADVQIKGRDVSIRLVVEGQAGEKYVAGVRKNKQRQPAPVFTIVNEAGKTLTSGRFKYG